MGGQIFGDLGRAYKWSDRGDTMREVVRIRMDWAVFSQYNAASGSIAVDLKTEEGRKIARELALQGRWLIEKLFDLAWLSDWDRPTGSDGAESRAVTRVKGFGEDGPYRDKPATNGH